MQQFCTYGSVRGAPGNRRPYRDTEHNSASESDHRRERGWKKRPKVRDTIEFERIGKGFSAFIAPAPPFS